MQVPRRTPPVAELGFVRRIMSAFSFGGIWTHPSLTFPDHAEFMCIDESRGRIITFVVISIEPVKHVPMRSWYPAGVCHIHHR